MLNPATLAVMLEDFPRLMTGFLIRMYICKVFADFPNKVQV